MLCCTEIMGSCLVGDPLISYWGFLNDQVTISCRVLQVQLISVGGSCPPPTSVSKRNGRMRNLLVQRGSTLGKVITRVLSCIIMTRFFLCHCSFPSPSLWISSCTVSLKGCLQGKHNYWNSAGHLTACALCVPPSVRLVTALGMCFNELMCQSYSSLKLSYNSIIIKPEEVTKCDENPRSLAPADCSLFQVHSPENCENLCGLIPRQHLFVQQLPEDLGSCHICI